MFRGIKKRFKKNHDDDVATEAVPVEDVEGVEELLDDEEWDEFEDEEEEQLPRKERILRGVRSALISMVVLAGITVGLGVGYIWYMGENELATGTAIAQPVETPVRKEVKPTQRDPDAPFGASVQMLTTPVAPGSNADITVKSAPEATCTIAVEINEVPLKDSGLVDRKTDEFGMVMWSWTVPENAKLGEWPVKVTCSIGKRSAVVVGEMTVADIEEGFIQ